MDNKTKLGIFLGTVVIIIIIIVLALKLKKENFATVEHQAIGNGIIGRKHNRNWNILSPLKLRFVRRSTDNNSIITDLSNILSPLSTTIIDRLQDDYFDINTDINILDQVNSGSEEVLTTDRPLSLDNGLSLTFGQILSMGGDFYGVPDRPICKGTRLDDRKTRFQNAFKLLNSNTDVDSYGNYKSENVDLNNVINEESDIVKDNLNNGRNGSVAYTQLAGNTKAERLYNAMKYAEATGAENPCKDINPTENGTRYLACTATNMASKDLEGRYFKLAKNNLDHFTVDGALLAYDAGHKLALDKAMEARSCRTINCINNKLAEAYKYEAFACHFLTDMFATGHMRTQRELLKNGPPDFTGWSETVGDMMSGAQHDYDNTNGLYIKTNACFSTNPNESRYCKNFTKVYGDAKLLDSMDNIYQQDYRNHIAKTVQESIDQIWHVYRTGRMPTTLKVSKYLPNTNFMGDEYRSLSKQSFRLNGVMAEGLGFSFCLFEPDNCVETLGPEWRQESSGDCYRVCVRDRVNGSPLLYYDNRTRKMYYKREDDAESFEYGPLPDNTMEDVDSQLLTYLMDT
jgi:hypothetical protein